MRVLLFDRSVGGHHLEYIGRLTEELLAIDDGLSVELISPIDSSAENEHLVDSEAVGYTPISSLTDADTTTAPSTVERVLEYAEAGDFDLLHFLHMDDLMVALYTADRRTAVTPVVGSINGAFFHHPRILETVCGSLRYRPVRAVERTLYDRFPPSALASVPDPIKQPIALMNLLADRLFDHLFVHSTEAQAFLRWCRAETPVTVVPDPLDIWSENGVSKAEARETLDLDPTATVALFFGELRKNKGIEVLLNALKQYDGPRFTMVIAGSPVDVSEEALRRARDDCAIDLRLDLEFIPEALVQSYFRAADVVVIPYLREFGKHRTSSVLQKACGSARPVVAPDYGTLGRTVVEYDLGLTFEVESAPSLARALREAVRTDSIFDPASMEQYGRRHTYERLAERTYRGYRSVMDTDTDTDPRGDARR